VGRCRTKLRTYSIDLDCAKHPECTSQSALRSAAAQNAVTATSCIRQYSSATIIANWLCRAAASHAKTTGSTGLDLKKLLENEVKEYQIKLYEQKEASHFSKYLIMGQALYSRVEWMGLT
jgi:hypothetical protein